MREQCVTTSGPYRCTVPVGKNGQHDGACEAQAPAYVGQTEFFRRNGFYLDQCKVHGLAKHVGGICKECTP